MKEGQYSRSLINDLQEQRKKLEEERQKKQLAYSEAAKWLKSTLNESGTIKHLLAEQQGKIAVFLKGGSLWEKIMAGFAILFSSEVKIKELYNIYKNPHFSTLTTNISDPVMQQSLVENGGILEIIGNNADNLINILEKARNTNETSPTRKLQDQLTPALLRLLQNKESRKTLQNTLLKNYMKFPNQEDIEQKGYKYNYWPRSSLAQFYPDWLTLTTDIMTLTDQQEGAKELKTILGNKGFLRDFTEMVKDERPLDEFPHVDTKAVEELWQTKDNEVSEKIKETLSAGQHDNSKTIITEEWYLMGPEILTALKQNQIDNINAILKRNFIDTSLTEEQKTNLKKLWNDHQKTVKQETLKSLEDDTNIDKVMHCWRNGQGLGHSISQNLEFFGIDIGFIENAHSLFEKPADVGKIVQAVKDSDFATLLTILKQHDLKSFIEGNPQHLQNLIKTILDKNSFILDSIAMPPDEILSIISVLTKDFDQCQKILSLQQTGKYPEMAEKLLALDGLKEHLKNNKGAYANYISELSKEGQPLAMLKNTDQASLQALVSNLLDKPEQIQDLLAAYENVEYIQIADDILENEFLMEFLQKNNTSLSALVVENTKLQQILSWALDPEKLKAAKSALKTGMDIANIAKGYQISTTDAAKIAAVIEGQTQSKLEERLQAIEYNSLPQDEQNKWEKIKALVNNKNLSNTEFNTINFNQLNIDGFNFDDTNLIGCSFENTELKNTSFARKNRIYTGACLKDISFKGAKLENVSFEHTYFQKDTKAAIDFTNAELINVDFSNITCDTQLNFANAKIDDKTLSSLVTDVKNQPTLIDKLQLDNAIIVGKEHVFPHAKKIGQKIGEVLFGTNMSDARKADTEKIIVHLAKSVLPKLEPSIVLTTIEEIEQIKGEHTQKAAEKLNKFVYSYKENSMQSTWMGLITNGIQLDEAKLNKNGSAILNAIQKNHSKIAK